MDHLAYLKKLNLFRDLDKQSDRELALLLNSKVCEKNTELDTAGLEEMLYLVKTGKIALYSLSPNGKQILIATYKPGDILGNFSKTQIQDYYAVTTEKTLICTISKKRFFDFAAQRPNLAKKLFEAMLEKLAETEGKIAILASDSALDRITKLFKQLVLSHGVIQNNKSYLINKKFTHEELSEMMGLTRQTTTTLINELEREGLLYRQGKYINVSDKLLKK